MKKIYITEEQTVDILSIKKRIRNLREQKRYSQDDIGEVMGVSSNAYGKYEQEFNFTLPDITKLILLADFYGVSTDYILKGNNSAENSNNTLKSQIDYLEMQLSQLPIEKVADYIAIFKGIIALNTSA